MPLAKIMTESERAILQKSYAQFTHFIEHHEIFNTPGTPSSSDLDAILNNAVDLPSATSVAVVPNDPNTTMERLLDDVQTLNSYISILSAFCIYNEHPQAYDITKADEAYAFARAQAKWHNYVITGGAVKSIAKYLPVSTIAAQSFSKEVISADLHLEFLSQLFGSFSFPEQTMKELDGVLTKVVQQLGQVKISFESSSSTLDHFITFYSIGTVAGTGGPGQPPAMYTANVRIFYLHIDQSSWAVAIGKSSGQKFKFNMNYYDMSTTMSASIVEQDKDAINKAMTKLTSKTPGEIKKVMNMQEVHGDPKP